MHQAFKSPRNRDAWGTIRGYVYQIETTVLRWLELDHDQVLELERGEDIDLVSLVAPRDGVERTRVLEQIKHLERRITLKHGSIAASIANFIESRNANAGIELFFRFTTTASIGRERPSHVEGNESALSLWEQVRSRQVPEHLMPVALASIRATLLSANRPKDLPDTAWTGLRELLSDNDNVLEDLIGHFEIASAATTHERLEGRIQAALQEAGQASNKSEAIEQYHRLVIFVLKALCVRGVKRLTPEQLDEQISRPALAAEDRALLHRTVQELDALGLQADENTQAIDDLSRRVDAMAKEQNVDIAVAYTRITPAVKLPPAVDRLSTRKSSVASIAELVGSHTWTALHGITGLGKSQLALLTAHHLEAPAAWISFHELTDEQACLQLDLALARIAESDLHHWEADYPRICPRISGWLVVLDDLPPLLTHPKFSRRMVTLLRSAEPFGIRFLTTAHAPPPAATTEQVAAAVGIVAIASPRFTNDEAAELLTSYGAPRDRFDLAPLINTLAEGHPIVLAAIARFFADREWRFTESELRGLIQGEYRAELNLETVQQILHTVVDDQSRELLYRLDLVLGSFSVEDVRVIANVAPTVVRPSERLSRLIGLWIQQESEGLLRLSPLVHGTKEEVSSTVKQHVRLALADSLLARSTLNQHEVANLFLYLYTAAEIRRAGAVLLRALNDLRTQHITSYNGALLSVWADQPLPDELDRGAKLFLRALQIALRSDAGMSVTFALRDVHQLADEATEEDAWALLAVYVHAAPAIAEEDGFVAVNRLVRKLLALHPHGSLPLPVPSANEEHPTEVLTPETLLWLHMHHMQDAEDAATWLDTVEALSQVQRERAFSSSVAAEGSKLVTTRVWTQEADKPHESRDWQGVLSVLERFARVADSAGLPVLYACAVHGIIVVTAEYLGNLPEAHRMAEQALPNVADHPASRFLVMECLGRQYLYAGRHEEAARWLEGALALQYEDFVLEQVDAWLALSRTRSDDDPEAAVQCAERAVTLAEAHEAATGVPLVQALGELSVARWKAGHLPLAFDALDDAAERLLEIRDDSDVWKGLFVTLGHVVGFLTSVGATGRAPIGIPTGEDYVAPEPGFFQALYEPRAAIFQEQKLCYIHAQLAEFAAAVRRDDRATAWAIEGLELARNSNQLLLLPTLVRHSLPAFLRDQDYEALLESVLEDAAALVTGRRLREAGSDDDLEDINVAIAQTLERTSGQDSHRIFEAALKRVHVPLVFHLARLALANRDTACLQAKNVAQAYRSATENHLDTPWRQAAGVLESALCGDGSGRELLKRTGTGGDLSDGNYLQVTGYVLASVHEDTPLVTAVRLHAACLDLVQQTLESEGVSPLAYRAVVVPFISEYWSTAFSTQRFRFSAPTLVERDLARALKEPHESRVRAILKTMVQGLRVSAQVPWLRSD